jgi:hypothetical protein
VSFAAITLCVVSQRVFIVVSVYFVIDLVRKLLDTPSYATRFGEPWCIGLHDHSFHFSVNVHAAWRFVTL